MLDTGAQPNIIKIGTLNNQVFIDNKQILKLKGITEDIVETLGTVYIHIFETPIIFHVVNDDFPIRQQGILGSSFFTEHYARIDYGAGCVTWKRHKIPFKNDESIVIPARSNVGFMVNVSNPEIKTGYLP